MYQGGERAKAIRARDTVGPSKFGPGPLKARHAVSASRAPGPGHAGPPEQSPDT